MNWNAKRTPEENSAKQLPRAKKKYWKSGEKLLEKHLDFKTLHKFRLKTKRYRYTLELFQKVDPSIESELKKLKPVQDLLGDINDCATVLELIGAAAGKNSRFAQYLHERAAKKTARLSSVLSHRAEEEPQKL